MSDTDPFGEYAVRADKADTRRASAYWTSRFLVSILVFEGPRVLKEAITERLSWWVNLLRGTLPALDEDCRLQGCGRGGVAHLPDDKSWTDGTPVCGRHYVTIKAAVYGVVAFCLATLGFGAYYVVMSSGIPA